MQTVQHTVDVCVVGGGLSGLCAAVAAARQGASVVLMHDRPVLGGNASSEIRVWVQGAYGSWDASVRETGLIEEIMLDTLAGNPGCSWSLWDLALHALAQRQPGLTTLLNCACVAGEVEGLRVRGVRGWQGTTQTWHEVHATQFIDASGDSILAMLSGAEVRRGREAASEFREPDASAAASDITMGNSLLFIWRDMGSPQPFHAPDWAYRYPTEAEAPRHPAYFHASSPNGGDGSFYVETGGRLDTIHDAEALREELLKIGLGLVDHLKNHGDHGMEQLNLEWFGMLPGKRESWRYVGDVVFTENDAAQGTVFPDIVAYGGWPIDDHHPDGTLSREGDSDHVWHKVACPYGIPYRALYSRSHDNLLCAGRNISATHLGLCTTRVMATCALIGQAAGTAAALAARHACTPRAVGQQHLAELQHALMHDDCWLPGLTRQLPALTLSATLTASHGDAAPLRDGMDRPDERAGALHAWTASPGAWAEYRFPQEEALSACRLVFDSDLRRKWANMPLYYPRDGWRVSPPATLVRAFRILVESQGQWHEAARITDNHQRLVRLPLTADATAVRLVIDATWGDDPVNVFAWDVC